MKIDELVALDIHTHVEEPCCGPRDDGYDELQAAMAKYFKTGHDHLPRVCLDGIRDDARRDLGATPTRRSRASRPRTPT